jgi:hypothetical protein
MSKHLESMAIEMHIAALDAIKAQISDIVSTSTIEQIAHDVVEAIIGALSPPGDYVQALAEIGRLKSELERGLAMANGSADREQDRVAWCERDAAKVARLTAELDTARNLRESFAKECREAQANAREAINQRDAAERTVRRLSERAPDSSEAAIRREQIATALGYAERSAANLGDAIAALRKEIGS